MISSRRLWGAACAAVVVAGGSCTDASAPVPPLDPPAAIAAHALGLHVVRVDWSGAGGTVEGYRLERRVNLTGPFVAVAPVLPPIQAGGIVSFLDSDVEPETFYGYRVFALGALGHQSGPSLVAGTRTPPPPGIEVATISTIPVPDATDPDGYWVTVEGPTNAAGPVGVNDRRRFTPLAPGPYTVTLGGVRSSCEVDGATAQTVTVTDIGLRTVDTARFRVVCRDPARGGIQGSVVADGDSVDPNGFRVTALGILADATLPDSERIVQLERGVGSAGGAFAFDALQPGSYEIALEDVAPHCTVADAPVREVTVAPLSVDTVHFAVECRGTGAAGRPYVLQNAWSPDPVGPGLTVTLTITLDLSTAPGEAVSGVQADLRYNPATLQFTSAEAGTLGPITQNEGTPGVITWLAATTATPPTGVVTLARMHFTAVGATGGASATRTSGLTVAAGDGATALDTLIRVVEDTVTIGSGGGGGNAAPTARANGPYSGTVNVPISFMAAGSNDPDGSIASYAWTFGDGTTGTGATLSHSYANAGTYTATLTVTDNLGSTDTDQATVTVTAAGGTTPLTWAGTFGVVNVVDSVVVLTLTLDLTPDIPETPSPEALATFAVDSLKWDATVLKYWALNWGPGGSGSVQTTHALQGKLVFSNQTALPANANSGVVAIATVRFKVIGTRGRSTTTATALGPLIGTPATGTYNYRSKTAIVEGTFIAP